MVQCNLFAKKICHGLLKLSNMFSLGESVFSCHFGLFCSPKLMKSEKISISFDEPLVQKQTPWNRSDAGHHNQQYFSLHNTHSLSTMLTILLTSTGCFRMSFFASQITNFSILFSWNFLHETEKQHFYVHFVLQANLYFHFDKLTAFVTGINLLGHWLVPTLTLCFDSLPRPVAPSHHSSARLYLIMSRLQCMEWPLAYVIPWHTHCCCVPVHFLSRVF